jgi:hypothetical protein
MFETAFRLCHFAVTGTISLIDRVLDSDPEGDSDDTGPVEDRIEDAAEAASRLSAAAAGRLLPPAGGHSLSARAGRGQQNAAIGTGASLAPPAAGRTRARRRVVTLQVRTSSSCSTSAVGRHQPFVVLSHSGRTTSCRRSLLSSRRRRGSKYVPHLEVIPEERDSLMEDGMKGVRGHYWEDSLRMLQSSQMAGSGLRARA